MTVNTVMKISELTSGVNIALTNEEADLLKKIDSNILRKDLSDREQVIANNLVIKGLLTRKKIDGKTTFQKLTETRNYQQQAKGYGPIRRATDLTRELSTPKKDHEDHGSFIDFRAIRHNAAIDGDDELKRAGELQFKHLFDKEDSEEKRLELAWYNNMSPEQQRYILKQHGRKSFKS
jgi:hypothetical protein